MITYIGTSHFAEGAPPIRSGWDVAWHDEFDGTTLNQSLWTPIFSLNPTNNSQHAYLQSQVTVGAGNLVLTSTNQPFQSLPYRSGQVISKSEQKFGRWEVRAKLPTSRGMWPAIWLLPDVTETPWPSGGEIDIMENRGDQPNLTSSAFHYGTNNPYRHFFEYDEQQTTINGSLENYHDSFHTYAVEWEPDQLRFFVDDVHYYTLRDSEVGGFISNNTAPMQLVINTAIGGNFLANPNGSTVWPQQFLIDYVHVYSKSSTPEVLTFENGGFDVAGGSLGRWSTFGNEFPNVGASNTMVKSGVSSLKLFGQFSGNANNSGVEQGLSVTPGETLRAVASALTRADDSIVGTNNRVELKIDYYRTAYGEFGSGDYLQSETIVLADGGSANNFWLQEEVRSTVPANAVEARVALVFTQPNNQSGSVYVDDVFFGRPGETSVHWDGNGDGLWTSNRWVGGPYAIPTDFDRAVITGNRVTVTGGQVAASTDVVGGVLNFDAGLLLGNLHVDLDGALAGNGIVNGDLLLDGKLLMRGTGPIVVNGAVELGTTARLEIDPSYDQPRGTIEEGITVLSAASLNGEFDTDQGANQSPLHLGRGFFASSTSVSDVSVDLSIYAALLGDANGDGVVDISDFHRWSENRTASDVDWTQGDFNGDGIADVNDFNIWNAHKFTTVNGTVSLPEPNNMFLLTISALWIVRRPRLGKSYRQRIRSFR